MKLKIGQIIHTQHGPRTVTHIIEGVVVLVSDGTFYYAYTDNRKKEMDI